MHPPSVARTHTYVHTYTFKLVFLDLPFSDSSRILSLTGNHKRAVLVPNEIKNRPCVCVACAGSAYMYVVCRTLLYGRTVPMSFVEMIPKLLCCARLLRNCLAEMVSCLLLIISLSISVLYVDKRKYRSRTFM